MHHFAYRDGVLHVEGVSLARIAEEVGTPTYVYSTATALRHYRVFRDAFLPAKPAIFYAMKAGGNLSILRTLGNEGAGADVVSEGEVRKALTAGIPPERIVFSGVGKSEEELTFAVAQAVHQINVETPHELGVIDRVARTLGRRQDIVFRVNPAIGAGGHAKITTGSEDNKFGVSMSEISGLYAQAETLKGVRALGLACHIGSQIHELGELEEAFQRLATLVRALRADGRIVTRLDLGGGLGIHYEDDLATIDKPDRIKAYADMVLRVTRGLDVEIAFEPGRLIIGNAGVLLSRVVTHNPRPQKDIVVLDAGMNDLIRPAMYDSFHALRPVKEPMAGTPYAPVDVVGPICESSDTFASDRPMPALAVGDVVAFMTAGAYGASMSSNYNQRRLVAEVLVDGDRYAVIRPRQTWDELIGQDRMAPWLTNA
jgi:diaminopimelate decarboxylase